MSIHYPQSAVLASGRMFQHPGTSQAGNAVLSASSPADRIQAAKRDRLAVPLFAGTKETDSGREKPKLSTRSRLKQLGWKLRRGFERVVDVLKWALLVTVGMFAFLPVPEKMRAGIERLFLRGPFKSPSLDSQRDERLRNHIQEISFNMGQFHEDLAKTDLGYDPKHDNMRLHAWFLPGRADKPCIVYSYGRGSNVSHHEALLKSWMDKGYRILIYDYPNYGRSVGRPSEEAFYKSSLAACLYARKYLGVPVSDQVLMGNSLGSVVAANTVQHLKALGEQPKAVALVSTFPSVKEAFKYNRDKFWIFGKWLNPDKISLKLDVEEALKKNTEVPVCIIQGNSDSRTPPKMIKGMLDRIGDEKSNKPKTPELKELDGLKHCIKDKDFPNIVQETEKFLDGLHANAKKESLDKTA